MKLQRTVAVTVFTVFCAATVFAIESQAPKRLAGLWISDPLSITSTAQECRVSFEVVDGDRVIRTTGELVYSTKVVFNPKGRGWELTEVLEQHNGQPNCFGKPADEVVAHLNKPAYVELQRGVLKYYRSASDSTPALRFVHTDATAQAGQP